MKQMIPLLIFGLSLVAGCGGKDVNQDLKPVDPNATKPKPVGGPQPNNKAATPQGPTIAPPSAPE